MFNIGKSYLVHKEGKTRLCADIVIDDRLAVLWFAVDSAEESWLAIGRSDPFVMALLPGAMRQGHDICCKDPMSRRLCFQLNEYLIPALAGAGELYHNIHITAPLISEVQSCQCAVGTGFSGGVDSLYTVMQHGKGSEYPLTHIAVFNNGVYDETGAEEEFRAGCMRAAQFAKEQELGTVFLDTNFGQVLPERFLDVYSFRNLACAMALGRLFSVYLCSSGSDAAHFKFNMRNSSNYDLLTVRCASTETLTFYHSGEEARRVDKLRALSDWTPSRKYLHPCFRTRSDRLNCGHCRKCVRDMAALYAFGKLDCYGEVYDVEDYLKNFAQRMGVLLAHGDGFLYAETIQLLKEQGVPIPSGACVYERQFRRAMDCLRKAKGEGSLNAEN